jgi:predicted nuclease of predicted toxin-antitoxin system
MSARKLLVDSCVSGAVARRLREDGHDVAWLPELGADPGDKAVLELASAEQRALITIDADFGALVFRDGETRIGVLRLRERPAAAQAARASELIATHGEFLEQGAFVTDDGASVRVTPL